MARGSGEQTRKKIHGNAISIFSCSSPGPPHKPTESATLRTSGESIVGAVNKIAALSENIYSRKRTVVSARTEVFEAPVWRGMKNTSME